MQPSVPIVPLYWIRTWIGAHGVEALSMPVFAACVAIGQGRNLLRIATFPGDLRKTRWSQASW